MSGSPITSVPEPDSAGALASVITQVSQNAPAPILGRGPARPTKVAKSKKKSASAAAASTPASTSTSTQAAGSAAAQAVAAQTPAPVAGGSSTVPESQTDTSAAPVVAPADGDKSLDSKVEHSNQPSSTVVDASDKEKEKVAPAAATTASEATPSTTTAPIAPAADAQQPPPPIAKTDPPPPPPKKAGAFSRILAVLTCSSSAGAMAAEDKADRSRRRSGETKKSGEKRKTGGAGAKAKPALAVAAGGATIGAAAAALGAEKKGGDLTPALKANGKLAPPPRTPTRRSIDASNGGSAPGTPILGSDASLHGANTNVTPGGGTKIPREETGDVMSAAVVPPGSSFVSEEDVQNADGTYDDEDDEDEYDEDMEEDDEDASEEQRLIMQGGIGIPIDANGNPQPLLPELGTQDHGRKCLVLDLDETLVHSSFKAIQNADFIVPVEIEGTTHSVYVIKRPGVDEFMRLMGEIYEVVVFTASLSKYADPVLDILDIHRVVRHRLFRESCYNHKGNYVKDLSQLGRPIGDSIIIDNSPASYIFHPNNAVPVSSWFNDPHDTELTDLCPFLKDLSAVDDVRSVLDGGL